ncbi:Uncharacterised protein [Bordetella pertussis]|nr:Uncharacterised protein [Bordetella pertussis]
MPSASPRGNTPGKPLSTRRASLASQRLAVPATAFCSCTTSGVRRSAAMTPPGKAT